MRAATLWVAVLTVLLFAAPALGDGDPASDVLVNQNVFFPYPAPGETAASALQREVAAVYAQGQRVKVAVIASPTDLGAIPSLFGKPADYARFLGTELKFVYVGPLLIVMPAGFGIYDGGRSTQAEQAVLAAARPPGSAADELSAAATSMVARLRKANALRSPDILRPVLYSLQGRGVRGKTMKLQYQLYDDSGKASAVIQLRRASSLVKTITLPLRPVATFGAASSVNWRVPTALTPGVLRYCITATDPSGNRAHNCVSIVIS